jgi:predicted DNA-binding transcriptional regulator AlpA
VIHLEESLTVRFVPDDRLWSVEDLSAYLGIPVPTLYRWRRCRCGPPCHRIGRHLRYLPEEVGAWLREQP